MALAQVHTRRRWLSWRVPAMVSLLGWQQARFQLLLFPHRGKFKSRILKQLGTKEKESYFQEWRVGPDERGPEGTQLGRLR